MVNKEFCPKECLFKANPDNKYLDDCADMVKDCWYLNDKIFDEPREIELLWYQDKYEPAFIIGENDDDWIVISESLGGYSRIKKNSTLIKDK